ncbi:MAG: DUF413 domain-containing protein [Planctomycetia bacterium]|nr:DUF413 domain-containing protein [Planctomycetia bacterium]
MQNIHDHAAYLARRDFVITHPDAFTADERDLLTKYGRWLEALAAGILKPTTPNQEQFVRSARGEREPETDFERAWAKVLHERALTEEVVRTFQTLGQARATAARLEAEYLAARQVVLQAVRDKLDAVDAAFAERMQNANEAAAVADRAVRELVMRLGRSIRTAGVSAIYHKARVSWDNEQMEGYAQRHPEVKAFRKVGKPIVALRFGDTLASDRADKTISESADKTISESGEITLRPSE